MPDDFSMFDLPVQDEPQKPVAPKPEDDKVAKLEAQLAALQAAQDTERRTNQELMARMFAGTAQPQPQTPQVPQVAINLDGLPDPRDDYEGYHRGLAERLGQTMQDMRNAVRTELTQEQHEANSQLDLANRAWARFGETHEELAQFPELVETATAQVFNEYRQRGVDPMRLMTLNMDDVVESVAARSQQMVDRIRGKQDQQQEDEDTGRTQMLGGAPPKPRARQQNESRPMDFVDSLKKLQTEMRIY